MGANFECHSGCLLSKSPLSNSITSHPNVFLLGSELEELLQEVLEAKDLGISVLDKHHEDNNWSYGQSILFTVTVVTTIGEELIKLCFAYLKYASNNWIKHKVQVFVVLNEPSVCPIH